MYYILCQKHAIGPFLNRVEAYSYMAEQGISASEYAVKSDMAMQQCYQHLDIRKPKALSQGPNIIPEESHDNRSSSESQSWLGRKSV